MSNLTKNEIEQLYAQMSAFEFKEILLQMAKANIKNNPVLDAGRGNPNWIAALPRQAFFRFGQFAVQECQSIWQEESLAGMPSCEGIASRFLTYLEKCEQDEVTVLLKEILVFGTETLECDADAWIYELTDGIIGDNYPFPDRALLHIEKVVRRYLLNELGAQALEESGVDVFPVEGGAAAMSYLFDSLMHNHLLAKGDKIALMTPIFTPYLEIPHLPEYEFEVIHIRAEQVEVEGMLSWQHTPKALDQLKDPSIKAVFIVNPNNPLSAAVSETSRNYLKELVLEHRPDLMIITDDVYGTFVKDFKSIMVDLPYHTLCIYSFSKYFGVTGWRLGTIALQEDNIFDEKLRQLNEEQKAQLKKRYTSLEQCVEKIKFIDRLVADSRQVALNHTAGLSTPQQVQMAFFSVFGLSELGSRYKAMTRAICKERKEALYEGLGVALYADPYDAYYYTEVHLLKYISECFGDTYVPRIKEKYKVLDALCFLAKEHGIVLLPGDGFASSKWSVRISLANLKSEDYRKMGEALHHLASYWILNVKE